MNHQSIYETQVSKTTLNLNQIKDLMKYLAVYQHQIAVSPADQKQLLSSKSGLTTPISNVYHHLVREGVDSILKLINIPKSIQDTPEVLTYPHLTFDIYQFYPVAETAARALGVTEFNKKILINITPWLNTRTGEFTSLSAFQSTVVRDALSRSYFTSNGTWISPSAMRSTGKVYTMSLASMIASRYQLTAPQSKIVSIPIAYYYFSKVMPRKDVGAFLTSSASTFKLDRSTDVSGTIDLIEEHFSGKDELSLEDLCSVLGELGIPKLQINGRILRTITASWGRDVHSSAMALEYPPYWVNNLLLAGSGEKTGLHHILKRMGLDRDIPDVASSLVRAPSLI